MTTRKFKIFETLENFRKLYEAAEDEMQAPADATAPTPEGAEDADPAKQANPEDGVFMSDNQKAEIAKMILDALMMTPPAPGTIPSNLMNVTTDNADEVIKYVQGLNALSAPLSLDNDADDSTMAGALKDI